MSNEQVVSLVDFCFHWLLLAYLHQIKSGIKKQIISLLMSFTCTCDSSLLLTCYIFFDFFLHIIRSSILFKFSIC